MITVGIVEDKKLGAVSWWRCYRPLMYMRRMYPDMDIRLIGTRFELTDIMMCDVIIMFRPTDPQYMGVISSAKQLGVKVILDVDDDLINLDPHHPLYPKYTERRQHTIRLFNSADYIWCSTEQLMYSMDCFGRGEVIPNAIDPDDMPARPSPMKLNALWRGNANHFADFQTAQQWWEDDEFTRRLNWVWLGIRPGFVSPDSGQIVASMPILDYLALLKKGQINFIWKPLKKNIFNDAKSNIAWLEATVAGAVCVTNYDGDQWKCAAPGFHMTEAEYIAMWEQSVDEIKEKYNIHNTARQRAQSILRLCHGDLPIANTDAGITSI